MPRATARAAKSAQAGEGKRVSHRTRRTWQPSNAVIITVGGNALPLNQLILSAREHALEAGVSQVYGVFRGYVGLMRRDFDRERDAANITTGYPYSARGGTFLRCYRGSPCSDEGSRNVVPELADQVVHNLNALEANILIVIGGNGTAAATNKVANYLQANHEGQFLVIFLPRTIDNDIGVKSGNHVDPILCPGYPSAVSNISRLAEDIIVEAESAERIYLVQTQGADSGWVAASGARGHAQHQLIPECFDVTLAARLVSRILDTYKQDGYAVVTVSEGLKKDRSKYGTPAYFAWDNSLGQHGVGRAVRDTADRIQDVFKKLGSPPPLLYSPSEPRLDYVSVHHSDYAPRMGSPSSYDLRLAGLEASFVQDIIVEHKEEKQQCPEQCAPVFLLRNVAKYDELHKDHFSRVALDRLTTCEVPAYYIDKDHFRCNPAFRDLLYIITTGREG